MITHRLHGSEIFIGEKALDLIPNWLSAHVKSKRVFVLVDDQTELACLPLFISAMHNRYEVVKISIPAGERNKTLELCAYVWNRLLDHQAVKSDIFIALGGGMITDLGGLSASLYKRGMKFVHVPTSLMGMTDAAIGGKTAVDFNNIKNALGLFSNPKAIFVDPVFLTSLPKREIANGWAEVVKHALIADNTIWDELPADATAVPDFDLLLRSIAVKVLVVQEDFEEKGRRKILNFGHTVGHAIETIHLESRNVLLHGEAVVWGMLIETEISWQLKLILESEARQIQEKLLSFFNPEPLKSLNPDQLLHFLLQDKKNERDTILFSLINDIGGCTWNCEVQQDVILSAVQKFIPVQ